MRLYSICEDISAVHIWDEEGVIALNMEYQIKPLISVARKFAFHFHGIRL